MGCFALVSLMVPAMVGSAKTLEGNWMCASAMALGAVVVWVGAYVVKGMAIGGVGAAGLLLLVYVGALATWVVVLRGRRENEAEDSGEMTSAVGVDEPSPYPLPEYRERGREGQALTPALSRLRERGREAIAAAVVTVVALLWLSWPVWLAVALRGVRGEQVVQWLAPVHPLLALNALFVDQGAWLQSSVIYRHVTLGQDVAYALPGSVWPSVILHLVVCVVGVGLARVSIRRPVSSSIG
jgi:hypothetical protein